MQPSTPGGSSPSPVGTLFTPAALSMLAQYSVLRDMGIGDTNDNLTSNWSDRTTVSDNFWSCLLGVPWEIQIALANETGKDMYINIPSNATPAYIADLADLFAYGSNGETPYTSVQSNPVWAPLDPNLKVYIEFSNELWNSGYVQAASRIDGWANQLSQRALYDYLTNNQDDPLYPGGGSNAYNDGAELASYYDVNSSNDAGFLGTYNAVPAPSTDGGSPVYFSNSQSAINGYIIGQGWIGLRDVQISQAFKTAFGEDDISAVAVDSRVRPLLEWQTGGGGAGGLGFISAIYGSQHPVNYYLYGGGGGWYDNDGENGFSDVSFVNPAFADGLTGWSSTGSTGVAANGSSMGNPDAPPLFSAIAITDGAAESGNTVTITTTAPHYFSAGQSVIIAGVTVAGYNGTFTITAVSTTTITYTDATTGLANSGDGIVTGTADSTQTAYLQPGASLSQNVTFSDGYADITLYATQNVPYDWPYGLTMTLTPTNGGPAINNGQPISESEGAYSYSSNENVFYWDQTEAFYTGASDYTYTITFTNTLPSGIIFLDNVAIQTVNGMFNETTSAVQSTSLSISSTIESSVNLALTYGLYDVGYEGGFDFNQNLDSNATGNGYLDIRNAGYSSAVPNVGAYANLDPRTAQLAIEVLDEFYAAGGTLAIIETADTNINSWAVAAPTYFNWNTPKQQSVSSVEQTAQPPTYGLKPGQSTGFNIFWVDPGQVSGGTIWLVPAGDYSTTVTFGTNPSAQAGQTDTVDVLLDGNVVGTITVPVKAGGTFTVPIGELPAGQYSVDFLNAAPAGSPYLDFGQGAYSLSQTSSNAYGGTPWPVPGIIQAENFDNGGEGVAYSTPHPGAGGDPYRGTEIGIQATTDTGGGYNVDYIYATEWLDYTVNVASAGTYQLSLRVASSGQGGTLHVDFGGVNQTGELTIPNTGGWQTWQTITTTVQLTAGQQIMQVDFDSTGASGYVGNFNWLELTAASAPLVVSAGSNFTANAGATVTFAGSVSGGTAPYTYGWTFGDNTTSSGSPTPTHVYANPGTYTAALTAADAVGDNGTSSVVVTVNDVPPTVSVNVPSSGTPGTAVSFAATATDVSPADQAAGFTYTWNFGDGGTATGAGPSHTFAVAGTYTVTVTATDEYGETGTASGTIVISTGSTPYGGTPWPVPGIIQAENFDNGGMGVAYSTPHPGAGGDSYRGTKIGIQATTDTGGGYNVDYIYATEWLDYTVNVASAGTYQLSLRVASSGQGGTLHVDFGGVNQTGELTIPNTGGWQTWQTITATVQLTAGQQVVQVDFDSTGASGYVGNFNWLELTAASAPLVVSAGSNFTTNAGTTVTFAGSVSGGIAPYTYGWTFGDGTTSSGSPTPTHVYANPGTYTAALTAADAVGDNGASSVVVTVNDVPPTVSVNVPSSGTPGTAVSFAATATDVSPADQAAGFTYTWNFGDGGTATGAGPSHTFAAAGTYTVTVTATDEYGETGTASGTIVISTGSTPYGGTPWPVPGIIQAENFDNGGMGVAYSTPHPGAGGDSYRGTKIGIQATTDTGGGYNVGYIYATEWLNYTVNVASAGTYQLSLRVASSGQGGTLHVDFGGVNETGELTVPNTGGWQTWQTITTTVQLTAGQQVMQVDFDSTGASGYVGNFNWLELTTVEGATADLVVPTSLAAASGDVPTAMTPLFAIAAVANPLPDDIGALDFAVTNSVAIVPGPSVPSKRPCVDGA